MTLNIHKLLSEFKNSYFVGFNSINFDEEFFRQILWEHFLFPYLTNTNGNLRLDVFNFATMVHAFRNNSINVNKNESGKINFKLENLAKSNNFNFQNAHEAIADVEVTMKLMKMLIDRNSDLFMNFTENSSTKKVEHRIISEKIFTLHNYLFNSHRVYLVKHLIKHPIYKSQLIGFDLKYDPAELIQYDHNSLYEVYKNKSFFRKIKINKQPTILDRKYASSMEPYLEFTEEEIELKNQQLDNKQFLENLEIVLKRESEEYAENKSQEIPYEEETIYSKNLNYKDSFIMKDFHNETWENKWQFAEKFSDPRLRFFAARHIYRNKPTELPVKIFSLVHKKISERLLSLESKNFTTIPSAMEEVDTLSLKMENEQEDHEIREQISQYNIYINFLNDYYSDSNPKPILFNESLSKRLFG
jgi:exonuclease I